MGLRDYQERIYGACPIQASYQFSLRRYGDCGRFGGQQACQSPFFSHAAQATPAPHGKRGFWVCRLDWRNEPRPCWFKLRMVS
jgi:hypothetical protein